MSGSEVLFNGLNASGQYELWAIKPGGSVGQITNVTGANTSTGLDPGDLTVFGTKVYFSGLDAAGKWSDVYPNASRVGICRGLCRGASRGPSREDVSDGGSRSHGAIGAVHGGGPGERSAAKSFARL